MAEHYTTESCQYACGNDDKTKTMRNVETRCQGDLNAGRYSEMPKKGMNANERCQQYAYRPQVRGPTYLPYQQPCQQFMEMNQYTHGSNDGTTNMNQKEMAKVEHDFQRYSESGINNGEPKEMNKPGYSEMTMNQSASTRMYTRKESGYAQEQILRKGGMTVMDEKLTGEKKDQEKVIVKGEIEMTDNEENVSKHIKKKEDKKQKRTNSHQMIDKNTRKFAAGKGKNGGEGIGEDEDNIIVFKVVKGGKGEKYHRYVSDQQVSRPKYMPCHEPRQQIIEMAEVESEIESFSELSISDRTPKKIYKMVDSKSGYPEFSMNQSTSPRMYTRKESGYAQEELMREDGIIVTAEKMTDEKKGRGMVLVKDDCDLKTKRKHGSKHNKKKRDEKQNQTIFLQMFDEKTGKVLKIGADEEERKNFAAVKSRKGGNGVQGETYEYTSGDDDKTTTMRNKETRYQGDLNERRYSEMSMKGINKNEQSQQYLGYQQVSMPTNIPYQQPCQQFKVSQPIRQSDSEPVQIFPPVYQPVYEPVQTCAPIYQSVQYESHAGDKHFGKPISEDKTQIKENTIMESRDSPALKPHSKVEEHHGFMKDTENLIISKKEENTALEHTESKCGLRLKPVNKHEEIGEYQVAIPYETILQSLPVDCQKGMLGKELLVEVHPMTEIRANNKEEHGKFHSCDTCESIFNSVPEDKRQFIKEVLFINYEEPIEDDEQEDGKDGEGDENKSLYSSSSSSSSSSDSDSDESVYVMNPSCMSKMEDNAPEDGIYLRKVRVNKSSDPCMKEKKCRNTADQKELKVIKAKKTKEMKEKNEKKDKKIQPCRI